MAYDRYDTRESPRGERPRWAPEERDRDWERSRGDYGRDRGERGFFERARDEISSWFGDDDDDRGRERGWRERRAIPQREMGEDRGRFWRDRSWDRDDFERDEERYRPSGWGARDRDFRAERERGYRPITGDYGRGERESGQFFAASGYGRGQRALGEEREAGRPRGGLHDPHYHSWRERHLSELDRDYDEYRREHQEKFEKEFMTWRERRQAKRGLLGQVREQMEVVGNDDEHVGTVDRVAGDRIILSKSDPASGGTHHSLTCMDIDRVESDRVVLDCSAAQARERWRDEDRSRALFEREDQGEAGPHILERSFEGTYR